MGGYAKRQDAASMPAAAVQKVVWCGEHRNAQRAYRLSIAPKGFAGVCCDIIDPASEALDEKGRGCIACGKRKTAITICIVERSATP